MTTNLKKAKSTAEQLCYSKCTLARQLHNTKDKSSVEAIVLKAKLEVVEAVLDELLYGFESLEEKLTK